MSLDVDYVVAYPRRAEVGEKHLLTVDVRVTGGQWPYGRDEEYPLECYVDAEPGFWCRPLGEGAVVLHRFGGTYGPAEFLLTAVKEVEEAKLRVTLVNRAGQTVKVLRFKDIQVFARGTGPRAAGPMGALRPAEGAGARGAAGAAEGVGPDSGVAPDEPPDQGRESHEVEPPSPEASALVELRQRPFSLILGDRLHGIHGLDLSIQGDGWVMGESTLGETVIGGGAGGQEELLQERLLNELAASGYRPPQPLPSLATIAQRYEMTLGREQLLTHLVNWLLPRTEAPPPFIEAIARKLGPGVHVSLSWMPWLERALAELYPDTAVHALMPAPVRGPGGPVLVERPPGRTEWSVIESKVFDLDREILVLRPYGGREPNDILGAVRITEDDHDMDTLYADYPEWEAIAVRLRGTPALFAGVSWLDERHRRLVRRLFDDRLFADGSALLGEGQDEIEYQAWSSRRVSVIRWTMSDLVAWLAAERPEGGA